MHAQKDALWLDRTHLIAWAVALVLAAIAYGQNRTVQNDLAQIVQFEIEDNASDADERIWRPVIEGDLKPQERLTRFKVTFVLGEGAAAKNEPLALQLSGLFSSSVEWNGQRLGENGAPARTKSEEKPGRIDAVFFIPAATLKAGTNIATITVSSGRNILPAESMLHRIAVKQYDADARRSLREYMAPIIALGVFLVAIFSFINLRRQKPSNATSVLAAIIAAAVTISAIAEITRAFINYPYPFHAVRIGALAISAAIFSAALVAYVLAVTEQRRNAAPVIFTAFVSLLVLLVPAGWNTKIYSILLAGILVAGTMSLHAYFKKHKAALRLLLAIAPLVLFAATDDGLYLDRFFYIALIPFLAGLYRIEAMSLRTAATTTRKDAPQTITFKERGRVSVVPLKSICAIKAAGNYAELFLSDGKQQLVSESLSELSKRLPENFLRAHRSYFVNLNAIENVTAIGPGKFEAKLHGGSKIPVARTQIKSLKKAVEEVQAGAADIGKRVELTPVN